MPRPSIKGQEEIERAAGMHGSIDDIVKGREACVIDGGFGWDLTIAGLTIYASDGSIACRVTRNPLTEPPFSTDTPAGRKEVEHVATRVAVALGLVTLAPAPLDGPTFPNCGCASVCRFCHALNQKAAP